MFILAITPAPSVQQMIQIKRKKKLTTSMCVVVRVRRVVRYGGKFKGEKRKKKTLKVIYYVSGYIFQKTNNNK